MSNSFESRACAAPSAKMLAVEAMHLLPQFCSRGLLVLALLSPSGDRRVYAADRSFVTITQLSSSKKAVRSSALAKCVPLRAPLWPCHQHRHQHPLRGASDIRQVVVPLGCKGKDAAAGQLSNHRWLLMYARRAARISREVARIPRRAARFSREVWAVNSADATALRSCYCFPLLLPLSASALTVDAELLHQSRQGMPRRESKQLGSAILFVV